MGWQEDLHNLEAARAKDGGRTPAPWHWEVHDSSAATLCGGGLDAIVGPVMTVGPCSACYKDKDEWEWGRCQTPSKADAALIAAAPDLLVALKGALEQCIARHDAEGSTPNEMTEIECARAAIAKAEGSAPNKHAGG